MDNCPVLPRLEKTALTVLTCSLIKSSIKNIMIISNGGFLSQCHMVRDVSDLNTYIPEDQTPSACGGRTSHDQLEWVEFFKVTLKIGLLFYLSSVSFLVKQFCSFFC